MEIEIQYYVLSAPVLGEVFVLICNYKSIPLSSAERSVMA